MARSGSGEGVEQQPYRGQWLYWVSHCPLSEPHPVVVTRVGRVWLTLSNGVRVHRRTLLIAPGEAYMGTVYRSREAYADAALVAQLRCRLRETFVSNALSDDDIKRVCALLGVQP